MSNIASMLQAAAAKRPTTTVQAHERAVRPTLDWESIDPATLPDDVQALYFAIGKARSAFEAAMTAMLEPPDHLKLAFAYKRGLAIALTAKAPANTGLSAIISRLNKA